MYFVLMVDGLEHWFNKNIDIVKHGVRFNKDETRIAKLCLKQQGNDFLRVLFDRVGVRYDDIIPEILSYTIAGEQCSLMDLSSGERDYLYALFCKYTDTECILVGTLERLDSVHQDRFIEDLLGYEKCGVVTMSRMIVGKDNLHLYREVQ